MPWQYLYPRRTKWPLRGGIVEPTVNVTASFHISPPRASAALYAPLLGCTCKTYALLLPRWLSRFRENCELPYDLNWFWNVEWYFYFLFFFLRMLREHSILFTFNLIRARYHFNSRVLTIWIEIEMFEINCRIYVMKIFIPVNMIFFLYLIRYVKVIFLFFLRMLREHLILFTFNFI